MTTFDPSFLPYDRLVAFGTHCEPAAQIRRYTGKDTALLFDWIETGWDGLAETFEANFSSFFKLENLRAARNDTAVTDRVSEFVFMHAYGKKGQRTIEPGMIERDYAKVALGMRFLVREFQEILNEERVLLIRLGHASTEKIMRLWDALDNAHPTGRFDFLIVNRDEIKSEVSHPRIRVDCVAAPAPGPNAWTGDAASWDALFARQAPLNKFVASDDGSVGSR